jgi:hypothetical protein
VTEGCVEIPQVEGDAFGYGELRSVPTSQHRVQTERLSDFDLDGRGSPVYRVPRLGSLGTTRNIEDITWDLYLLDHRCARLVAQHVVGAGVPEVLPETSHGLRNFRVHLPGTVDPIHHDWLSSVYRFDGKRYVQGPPEPR